MKNSCFRILMMCVLYTAIMNSLLHGQPVKIYKLGDYGIIPNSGQNNTPLLKEILDKIRIESVKSDRIVLELEKGRYDFFPEGAVKRTYYISNHDQTNPKTVGIALEDLSNVTMDGKGADLIFHGRMLPIAIIKGTNIKLKNLQIDFEEPHIAQVKIIENNYQEGSMVFEPAPWVKYVIKDSVFHTFGEGWQLQAVSGIAFESNSKRIVFNTGDIALGIKGVVEIAPGKIKAFHWKNNKLLSGTVVAMRSWQRPAPAIFVDRGMNMHFEDVKIHYAEGMGLLAQLTENIYMDGFMVCLRGEEDPRYFTTQADATHFSGCRGIISSKNGLYEGMMDDAINIHGTYLKVVRTLNKNTLIARYMHSQSFGFDWGYSRDTVQFIRSQTMESWDRKYTISSISPLQDSDQQGVKEFRIELTDSLDPEIDPTKENIGIENMSWTPSVVFTGNTIRNNRARGALFSTPKPVLVADNVFDHTSGCAILLCGDCNGWYETGACRDVTIRNNTFINSLTSMYQFTEAVISIYPEIPDLDNQKRYFHSGIKIVNNRFETFDEPLLYAKSVDGLVFKNNKIITNKQYPPFHKNRKRILFQRVINSDIKGNKVDGKPL